ncbi:uncharacterized protein UDID_18172 [Ustilago sp. UG-2017a]|nr:uncharacterized protein UDID_18172 [Ustilago sp. UG-2017a]
MAAVWMDVLSAITSRLENRVILEALSTSHHAYDGLLEPPPAACWWKASSYLPTFHFLTAQNNATTILLQPGLSRNLLDSHPATDTRFRPSSGASPSVAVASKWRWDNAHLMKRCTRTDRPITVALR